MRAATPPPSPLVQPATAGMSPEIVNKVRVSDTQLYLDGVSVAFDGFKAINNLALMVAPGELRTIIGPNGAGKTTMMDIITGKTKPDSGEVMFAGRVDLTKLDEVEIANLGIGRKFQKPTVFENLTVFENFELALKSARGAWKTLLGRLNSEALDRIAWALHTVGLETKIRDSAGALSHGQKQWLEIGMLLVQDTQLILLDEPVAGMTDAETKQTAELILTLKGERTLVVVEHDMEFVRDLGAKVTVLHEGSVLSEGTVDHVQNDPRVIEVYLGR